MMMFRNSLTSETLDLSTDNNKPIVLHPAEGCVVRDHCKHKIVKADIENTTNWNLYCKFLAENFKVTMKNTNICKAEIGECTPL